MNGLIKGQYTNPKYGKKIKSKIANVIVTYVPMGQTERCPAISHIGADHVMYDENKLETIKFNLAAMFK